MCGRSASSAPFAGSARWVFGVFLVAVMIGGEFARDGEHDMTVELTQARVVGMKIVIHDWRCVVDRKVNSAGEKAPGVVISGKRPEKVFLIVFVISQRPMAHIGDGRE